MIINGENDFEYEEKIKVFSQFSPEIRNSFNSIIGISNLILDDDLAEDSNLKELIVIIQSAAYKSFDLLDNLIQYYEQDSENTQTYERIIDVNSIIKESVELFKYQIKQKNLSVILNLENYSEVRLEENLVSFIIRSLLSNLIKNSEPADKIEIEYIMSSNVFDFSIIRTPKVIQDQNDYFKDIIDNAGDSQIGVCSDFGSGVGLKLCQELIENMNGKIKIQHKYGNWKRINLMIHLNNYLNEKKKLLS